MTTKQTWEEWKHNFCQHISDWSYAAADEELEKMRSTELNNQKREIVNGARKAIIEAVEETTREHKRANVYIDMVGEIFIDKFDDIIKKVEEV